MIEPTKESPTNVPQLLGHLEKSKRVNFWEMDNDRRQQLENGQWVVDSEDELSPIFDWETWQQDGYEKTDFVDLKDLKPESTVYFFGSSHAFYTIKVLEGGKIKVWRDRAGQTTGLVTSTENLGIFDDESMDPDTNDVSFYPGCLASYDGTKKKPRIIMPYFAYEGGKTQEGKVLPPDDGWMGFVSKIYVKEAK